jgi:hypothetical protein
MFLFPLRLRARHRIARQPCLIRALGVTLDLTQRLVAADAGDLERGATRLREPNARRFA